MFTINFSNPFKGLVYFRNDSLFRSVRPWYFVHVPQISQLQNANMKALNIYKGTRVLWWPTSNKKMLWLIPIADYIHAHVYVH